MTSATRAKSSGWTKPALRTAAEQIARPAVREATHRPRAPFVLLVLGLLIGGLCALLALNTAAAASELRRHSLVSTNSDLTDQIAGLQAQIAAAQAPGALASAATSLGMVPDPNAGFLVIAPDGSVKVLGDPAPAPAAVKPAATPKPTPKPSTSIAAVPLSGGPR
jgi:hypothetical protein